MQGSAEKKGEEGALEKKLPLAARGGEGQSVEQISGRQACATA
jgi:hypothetical protein